MEETIQPDSTGTPDMVLGKYKEMVLGKQLDIKKKHKSAHFSMPSILVTQPHW